MIKSCYVTKKVNLDVEVTFDDMAFLQSLFQAKVLDIATGNASDKPNQIALIQESAAKFGLTIDPTLGDLETSE